MAHEYNCATPGCGHTQFGQHRRNEFTTACTLVRCECYRYTPPKAQVEEMLVAETLRRSEVSAQADDILANKISPKVGESLTALMRMVSYSAIDEATGTSIASESAKKQLTEYLPELLAFIKDAIDGGWIDEFIGRIEREAS